MCLALRRTRQITTAYSYNATGELTSAGTTNFAYDPNGNPDNAGETIGVDNELTTDGTYDYTYDHAGNEITKTDIATGDEWSYGYNNNNQMISAVETNASDQIETSVAYDHDAFGNQIESTTITYSTPGDLGSGATSSTRYAIDEWNPGNGSGVAGVWADLNVGGGLQTHYIRTDNPNQLLAGIDSGTAYWYLLDRQDSTRVILTNTATPVDSISYDAFGNALQTASAYGGRFLYTGEGFDSTTGLQNNNVHGMIQGMGGGRRWIRLGLMQAIRIFTAM